MNLFIGKRTESIQDLEMAKKLALKTVKDFESQYGSTGDLTLATRELLLNIYQMTGERELSIEQSQEIMTLMAENDPSSVNTIEYAQKLLIQSMSQIQADQLEAGQHNLNQVTNILATITDENDAIYE